MWKYAEMLGFFMNKLYFLSNSLISNKVEESLSIFDVDGEGWISRGQLKHLLCSNSGDELTADEFEELFKNLPGNEDGMIRVIDVAHMLNEGQLPKVTDL